MSEELKNIEDPTTAFPPPFTEPDAPELAPQPAEVPPELTAEPPVMPDEPHTEPLELPAEPLELPTEPPELPDEPPELTDTPPALPDEGTKPAGKGKKKHKKKGGGQLEETPDEEEIEVAEVEEVAPEKEQPKTTTPKKKTTTKSSNKGCLWFLLIFAVLFVIAAVIDANSEKSAKKPHPKSIEPSAEDIRGAAQRIQTNDATVAPKFEVDEKGLAEAPTSPKLMVCDFADIFSPDQRQALEDSLELFKRQTSNEIAVVTVPSLYGYDRADYAIYLGRKWGVGKAEDNNGIVILIKPKTGDASDEKGQVFIATGLGLEGAIPDVVCNRIVQNEMIPKLKEGNDYFGATWAALSVLMPMAKGEYSKEDYSDDDEVSCVFTVLVLFLICGFLYFLYRQGSSMPSGRSGGSSGWSGGSVYTGGRSWGGGSSYRGGGSSWGGGSSGGGFGGWGGGSFGGGGAGGSW